MQPNTARLLGVLMIVAVCFCWSAAMVRAQQFVGTITNQPNRVFFNQPTGIAVNGNTHVLVAANYYPHVPIMVAFDSRTGEHLGNFAQSRDGRARYLTIDSGTNRLYATGEWPWNNGVGVFDTQTRSQIAMIDLNNERLRGIVVDESTHRVYATSGGALNGVIVIDGQPGSPTEHQVLARVELPGVFGEHVIGVAIDSARKRLYVTQLQRNVLFVIDALTYNLLATIPVGSSPEGVAVDSGGLVYVANGESSSVSVIDGRPASPSLNTIIATIPVGGHPSAIAVNKSLGRTYVANLTDKSLSVISSTTLLGTLPIAPADWAGFYLGIAVDEPAHRVFVAHQQSDLISIVEDDGQTPLPPPTGPTNPPAGGPIDATCVYEPPAGTVLSPGLHTLTVTCTPNPNYRVATKTVTLLVERGQPVVTWTPPTRIVYGDSLDALFTAVADVPGVFTYSIPRNADLQAGPARVVTLTFTPSDANFDQVTVQASVEVMQATLDLIWGNPAPIKYGTPLSATQLNAEFAGAVRAPSPAVPGGQTPPAPPPFTMTSGCPALLPAGTTLRRALTVSGSGPADLLTSVNVNAPVDPDTAVVEFCWRDPRGVLVSQGPVVPAAGAASVASGLTTGRSSSANPVGTWIVTAGYLRADGSVLRFDQIEVPIVPGPETVNIAVQISGPANVAVYQLDNGPWSWSTDNNRAMACTAESGGPFCELTYRIGATITLQASGPYPFGHWRTVNGDTCDTFDFAQQTCTLTVRHGTTLRAVFAGYPE